MQKPAIKAKANEHTEWKVHTRNHISHKQINCNVMALPKKNNRVVTKRKN